MASHSLAWLPAAWHGCPWQGMAAHGKAWLPTARHGKPLIMRPGIIVFDCKSLIVRRFAPRGDNPSRQCFRLCSQVSAAACEALGAHMALRCVHKRRSLAHART
eukprot:356917-Chlamydomonas_euryale.AAC.14